MDNQIIDLKDESTGASNWFWNFGDYTSPENTSIIQNPTHKYSSVGKYTIWLVVSSDNGCMDSTYKYLYVENPYTFFIPNTFTPDKDGLNEVFRPYGRGIDPTDYTMMIFDRWGRLIFKTHTLFEPWDGLIDGQKAPIGVYAYRFFIKDLEGRRKEYSGHINIIR
jgi:gliding motility-associated-like protein